MNSTLFWRLAWKEYRMLRGFWIALALATVGLQLLAVVTMTLMNEPMPQLAAQLLGFGLLMVAFYALGSGATIFAVEREEETYDFLRSFPVAGRQVARAKFAVAVAGIVALWAFVYLESALVSGLQLPTVQEQRSVWGVFGLAAVEALVWGIFFSLVLRRPISAVLAAAVAGIVSVGLIVWWVVEFQSRIITGIEDMPVLVLYRVLLILVVAAANLWLARRWFDEALLSPRDTLRNRLARRRAPYLGGTSLSAAKGMARPRARILSRLLWQQWRQSRWTMVAMTGIGVAIVACLTFYVPTRKGVELFATGAAAVATVALTALAGASAFQSDQSRQSFRFLAERGVRPTTFWMARQLVWLAPITLWVTATVLISQTIGSSDWKSLVQELTEDRLPIDDEYARSKEVMVILQNISIVVLALAYCAGQFCSMFLRKGVVAWFFSLLLTGVLCYWAGIMDTLGISWVWSVAPIPLVLLVATWLRTPHWLLERTDWTARWQAVLSVVAPAAALAIAVIAFRVYQIPYTQFDLADAELSRPPTEEERTTAQMYIDAERMIKFPPTDENVGMDKAWWKLALADNQAAIQLALAATDRPSCSFYDHRVLVAGERTADFVPVQRVGRLLVASAQSLEEEGNLDAAWGRYMAALTLSRRMRPDDVDANRLEEDVEKRLPHWAARSGQTYERIKRAVDELKRFYATLPPPTDAIKADYITASRWLEPDPMPSSSGPTSDHDRILRISTALVPWEMARSRRLLKLVAALDTQAIERVRLATDRGEPYADALKSVHADTAQLQLGATTLFYQFGMPLPAGVADNVLDVENRHRATLILLALEAWKAKHGKLPETLSELEGKCLDKVPLDPYAGKPFGYVTWNSTITGVQEFSDGASYPDVPEGQVVKHLLWSAKPGVVGPALDANGAPILDLQSIQVWTIPQAWGVAPLEWAQPAEWECARQHLAPSTYAAVAGF